MVPPAVRIIDFSKVSQSPLNPLGRRLRETILQELRVAIHDDSVRAIVLTGGAAPNFSAGADLTEFASILVASPSREATSRDPVATTTLIDVVDAIEASPKPVVACLRGNCLGGGLEVALACHYRVALDANAAAGAKTNLGLPEVHVGVIPGAGGTQRLPRLIGLEPALRMILQGAPVDAKKALKMGLIDQIAIDEESLLETAVKVAQDAAAAAAAAASATTTTSLESSLLATRRLSRRTVPQDPATCHVICHVASLSIPRVGHDGIRAALEAIRASFTLPFAEGMKREGELFLQVLQSKEGRARRHAFFATRLAQKMIQSPPPGHPLLDRSTRKRVAGVIGGGTMGAGIALVLLKAGFVVYLVDISEQALAKGVATIDGILKSQVQGQKLSPIGYEQLRARLAPSRTMDDLAPCQIVVEAVVEVMKVKQSIFRQLDVLLPQDCIILSNTSTLDIDEMASVIGSHRRGLFGGWHFFSPAHVMKLVEIVAGKATSKETIALLQGLTKQVGKIGVVVGNCDGFCGNRLLKPYSAETVLLLTENGATVKEVDEALKRFGMALGPFEMGDLAGNDIGYNIRCERGWVRHDKTDPVPVMRPTRYTELADDMVVQLGRLGQKSGKGWYDYDPSVGKGRKAMPSAAVDSFVRKYVEPHSSARPLGPQGIVERVIFPLVNEGFKCLEEGIVRTPGDIDVVYLYGYGWPVALGGPMHWADHHIGLPYLLETLRKFQSQFPGTDHYRPSTLLEECVAKRVTVEEYYRQGLQKQKLQSSL